MITNYSNLLTVFISMSGFVGNYSSEIPFNHRDMSPHSLLCYKVLPKQSYKRNDDEKCNFINDFNYSYLHKHNYF